MGALSAMWDGDMAPVLAAAKGRDGDEARERRDAQLTFIASIALATVGYGGALVVRAFWDEPAAPVLADGLNAFTLLFVLALAIERVIQPFAPLLGPDSARAKAKLAAAKANESSEDSTTAEIQHAETEVADARGKTAIVTWGFATGLAALAAMALNVTVLGSVVAASSPRPAYWIDLLITALAVGAGTKPLNDLWTRLQNKSDS